MESVEKLLENPIVRILAGFGLLLVMMAVMRGLLFGLIRLTNQFERGSFERLWNLDRVQWVTIFLVLGMWIGAALAAKFEPTLVFAVAGTFFVWAVFVRNIALELPNFFSDLVFVAEPLLSALGVGLGFLTLARAKAPMNLSPATFGVAPTSMPGAAPVPHTTAPQAGVQPSAGVADASAAAGWFADPKGEAELRWWDGTTWTDNTN